MAVKIPVSKFVEFLINRQLAKDGYIMGATGQNPKKWKETSWWFTQYDDEDHTPAQKAKALYWREHAQRVWDCNGLAEGYYKDVTGIDINSKARYNYANWCSVKGTGKVPVEHRVPGLAVFMGKTASKITHVGYLIAPVDASKPEGDWYVIEARGVMYGVVKTKYNSRDWKYWGYMDLYYDYSGHSDGTITESVQTLGYRNLRKGDVGSDVKELQTLLLRWKSTCLPKFGADGEFGSETRSAVKAFQDAHNLEVDGIAGKQTYAALEKYEEPATETKKEEEVKVEETPNKATSKVLVTGGSVNVRTASNTSGKRIFIAHKGDKFDYISTENNWYEINTAKGVGWISGKYSKVVEE